MPSLEIKYPTTILGFTKWMDNLIEQFKEPRGEVGENHEIQANQRNRLAVLTTIDKNFIKTFDNASKERMKQFLLPYIINIQQGLNARHNFYKDLMGNEFAEQQIEFYDELHKFVVKQIKYGMNIDGGRRRKHRKTRKSRRSRKSHNSRKSRKTRSNKH